MTALFKKFGLWLAGSFLPLSFAMGIGYYIGFSQGHEAGRIEMKCAIMAVIEHIGDVRPAPGTITLGCDKRPARPSKQGQAA